MTVTAERIADLIRGTWPDVRVGAAVPLSGGYWAEMFRVSVTDQPPEVADEIVVRFAPDRGLGAKEAEVQRAAAAQGFATPTLWSSRPDPDGEGWWSVMDHASGAPLLAGLDGVAALRRGPSLARTLPVHLAQTMSALHRLDVAPVTAAVRLVAPDVAWTVDDILTHLSEGAVAAGRDDVEAALDALRRRMPDTGTVALCHGDLHPFNVLDGGGQLVLLDWTAAAVADPAFDVAFTELLLANPPLVLPGPLAGLGRRLGRLVARRFVDAYRRSNPGASLAALDWFRALHGARVLIDVTGMRAAHGPGAGGHPWALVAPGAARALASATGVAIRP